MLLLRMIKYYLRYGPIFKAIIALILALFIIGFLVYSGFELFSVGFIITPILTIFLIVVWDGYNSRKREYSLLSSFQIELEVNLYYLEKNSRNILMDIDSIDSKKHLVIPLIVLRSEIWEIIKTDMPSEFQKNNFIGKLAGLYFHIYQINEMINSRENFRINNAFMSNFSSSLRIYNINLLNLIWILNDPLEDIITSDELKSVLGDLNELKDQFNNFKSITEKFQDIFESNSD